MRKGFKKVMSFVLSAAMMVSLGSGMTFSTASAEGTNGAGKEAAQTTSGSALRYYRARVGFQTDIYTCRDEFKTTADGLAVEKAYAKWRSDNGDPLTDDYNGQNIYFAGNVPDYNSKKQTWRKNTEGTPSQEAARVCTGATVQDVKMTADGEYTVSIKNLDVNKGWKTKKEKEKYVLSKAFNMLYVATDIPISSGDNIAVKASSIKVAGKEVATNAVLPLKGDLNKGSNYQFMIADGYTADDKISADTLFKRDPKAGTDGLGANVTELKTPEGEFDIEITFSITGVDWSKAPLDGVEPTAPPEATAAPEATAPPEVTLKTPFDICVSSNMNTALSPAEGARLKADGVTKIQAATFGSQAMKAKIAATKGANGKTILDEAEQDYIVEDSASATITKTGEYTLTVTARGDNTSFTDVGAVWFPIMINGSAATMPKDFNLVGKSVKVGNTSYKWGTRMGADSSGDVRLTVYNNYETDPVKKADVNTIQDTIAVHKGDKISFTFYVTADAPAPARTATPEAIGASTSYMSYLGFQTNDWMFRDNWQSDTGLKCKDYNYKKQVAWSHDGKTQAVDVTSITDAKMTKNDVKYTVAINGINVKKTSKASTQFNMLYLSTDIPLSMKGVTVKNAVLKIDGKTIKNYKVVPNKGDASKYYQFMLADAYAPADGTKNAAYPDGKALKVMPTKSIEVEYTISGVDFNSRVVSIGNFKYKLTKNKAQVVGLSKKGKKKANLSLGKTIKVKAASPSAISSAPAVKTYKITSVKAGAFKNSAKLKKFSFKKATNVKTLPSKVFMNCKKLKTVELNKKMKKIPAKAFMGCKKLTTIKCNAKLKSVSKSAFKKCKKKIKVTGKSKKANKKKIKKVYKKVK